MAKFMEDILAKTTKVTLKNGPELKAKFTPLGVFKFNSKLQQTNFATQNQHYLHFGFITISWLTTPADQNLAIQIVNTNAKEALLDFNDCTDVRDVANVDLNLLGRNLVLQQ